MYILIWYWHYILCIFWYWYWLYILCIFWYDINMSVARIFVIQNRDSESWFRIVIQNRDSESWFRIVNARYIILETLLNTRKAMTRKGRNANKLMPRWGEEVLPCEHIYTAKALRLRLSWALCQNQNRKMTANNLTTTTTNYCMPLHWCVASSQEFAAQNYMKLSSISAPEPWWAWRYNVEATRLC